MHWRWPCVYDINKSQLYPAVHLISRAAPPVLLALLGSGSPFYNKGLQNKYCTFQKKIKNDIFTFKKRV